MTKSFAASGAAINLLQVGFEEVTNATIGTAFAQTTRYDPSELFFLNMFHHG
jgi:hypothetical protein